MATRALDVRLAACACLLGLALTGRADDVEWDDRLGERPSILVGIGDDTRKHTIDAKEPDPVKAFGTLQSKPIDNGLVIVNGRILKRPYVVTRRGLEILVNDAVVRPAPRWPILREADVKSDPGDPPPGLPGVAPEQYTPEDKRAFKVWWDYWDRKFMWLKLQGGRERALAEWCRLVAKHPDVSSAAPCRLYGDRTVLVVTRKRERRRIRLGVPLHRILEAYAEDVKSIYYEYYCSPISQGYLLIIDKELRWTGNEPRVWRALQVALSDMPDVKRWAELERLGAVKRPIPGDARREAQRESQLSLWRDVGRIAADEFTRAVIQRNVMAHGGTIDGAPIDEDRADPDHDAIEKNAILVGACGDTREHAIDEFEPDPVKAFGVRSSAPIGKGLVIVDGNVLKRPYVVTRRGLEILVNDVSVKAAYAWTAEQKPETMKDPGDPPPGMPGLAPDNDTPENERIAKAWHAYWMEKYRWLKSRHGIEKAVKEWARLVTRRAEGATVTPDPIREGAVWVVEKNGDQYGIDLEPCCCRHDGFIVCALGISEEYKDGVNLISDDGLLIRFKDWRLAGSHPAVWAALDIALSDLPEDQRLKAIGRIEGIQEYTKTSSRDEQPMKEEQRPSLWRALCRLSVDAATRASIRQRAKGYQEPSDNVPDRLGGEMDDRPEMLTNLVGSGGDTRIHFVDEGEPDPVKAFGIRTSAPIDKGLVIVDGKVLAPPYVVARRGLDILVNDTVVAPALPWPLEKEPDVKADPGEPPPGLPAAPPDCDTPQNERAAKTWWAYWGRKYLCLKRQHDQEKALAAWCRLVARHPDVASAAPDPESREGARLVTQDLRKRIVSLKSHRPVATVADRVIQTEEAYARYARWIEEGNLVLRHKSLHWTGGQRFRWSALDVALTDMPEDRRRQELERLGAVTKSVEGDERVRAQRELELRLWREVGALPVDADVRALVRRRAQAGGEAGSVKPDGSARAVPRVGDAGAVLDASLLDPAWPEMRRWVEAGVRGGVPARDDTPVVRRIRVGEDLQGAIDAAWEKGGVILLAPGRYPIERQIDLRSGVILRGEDPERTVLEVRLRNGSYEAGVKMQGVRRAGLEDLTILHAAVEGLDAKAYSAYQNDHGGIGDLRVGHVLVYQSEDCWVQNCRLLHAGTDPIVVRLGRHITFRDNVVRGCFNKGGDGNGRYLIDISSNVLCFNERVNGLRHFAIRDRCAWCAVIDCHITGSFAFLWDDADGALIEGCAIERPADHPWHPIGSWLVPRGEGNLLYRSDVGPMLCPGVDADPKSVFRLRTGSKEPTAFYRVEKPPPRSGTLYPMTGAREPKRIPLRN